MRIRVMVTCIRRDTAEPIGRCIGRDTENTTPKGTAVMVTGRYIPATIKAQ